MNGSFWRFNLLGIFFAAFGLVIISQIVLIQVGPQSQKIKDISDLYKGEERTLQPIRGQIYDRWGHLLAGNTTVYQIGAELQLVKNPKTIALAVSIITGTDYDYVLRAASLDPESGAVYAVLADYVTEEQKLRLDEMIEELNISPIPASGEEDAPSLAGLVFEPHLKRYYPEKQLASNIIGFVNREGKGYFGIEEKYNDLLSGYPKDVWVPNDPNRIESPTLLPEGASLILTIDREIQSSVQEILEGALLETGAKSGTIVVMQPETGEILAMASTPWINLNQFSDYDLVFPGSTPFNRAVSQTYEPGSVFKVITMAAALDSKSVKPDTPFLDTGVYEIGGIYIRNWNLAAWGPQTMLGCMQHSLNVCLAWVANEVGAPTYYEYLRKFGIGRLTGVDLAGEAAGRLKTPGDGDWYEADLGTNSFGQGVSVTPIQMLMAVSAIANEGKMVVPHVLQAVVDKGVQQEYNPQVAGSPISVETAQTLTEMLAVSLEEESSNALVEGYRIAGKTGTAEIPTPLGYTSSATNASFVGWGPTKDPQFLIYVWLEEPSTSPWGSVVAAPVFRQVAERVIVLMNIPPDSIRKAIHSQ